MNRTTTSPVWDPTKAELRLNVALQQMLEAHDCAQKLGQNTWQFSLEIGYLCSLGLRHTDLRWLVWRGYVEHGVEETMYEHTERVFRRPKNLMFAPQSCFVLTRKGVFFAQHVLGSRTEIPKHDLPRLNSTANSRQTDEIPVWDGEQHTLFWRERAVHHFRHNAAAQEAILRALQAQNWRHSVVVSSLRKFLGSRAVDREFLRVTIKNLNRSVRPYLRFRLEANGSRLNWEARQ